MPTTRVLIRSILRHRPPPRHSRAARPAGHQAAPDPPDTRPRWVGRLHAQFGAGLVHERRGGGADRGVVSVDARVEDKLPADLVLAGYAPADHPDPAPHAPALGSEQRVVPGEGDRLLDPNADVLW